MGITTLLTSAFLFSVGWGHADSLVWRNAGPGGGGWIQSIAMDPLDADTIHVGCDVGGYYKSTDGGKTFRIQNTGLTDYFIERILVDPTDNDTLYLGTQSGVFKTTDGGATWVQKRNGFPPLQEYSHSAPIGALAMHPTDAKTIYAGIGKPRQMRDGKGHVYKSTDGAETWTLLDGIAKLANDAVVHQLAIRPDDPDVLFAATQRGLFRSDDAGVTWERKEQGLPHRYCRNVAIHPKRPDVMYVVLWSTPSKEPWHGGVYRSDDGGETWAARNEGLPQKVAPPGDAPQKTCNFIRLALDPRDPDRVYVGGNAWWGPGVYRSTDGGRNWELSTRYTGEGNMDKGWITFWGPGIKCLDVSPLNPDTVVYGDSGRVMRSDDRGDSWRQLYAEEVSPGRWRGNGVEVTCLHEITVDPFDPKKLYLGYADIGLMVSEDRGDTWRRSVEGLPAQGDLARVVCDPKRQGVAWCCEGKGKVGRGSVSMTTDGGKTWQVVGSEETGLPKGATAHLLLDPDSPVDSRTLYVAAVGQGVYKSTDCGKTWKPASNGLGEDAAGVADLVMAPHDSQRLFAARGPGKADPMGGLFMTDDGGANWRKLNQEPELPDIRSIAVDPRAPRTVFVACRRHYSHTLKRLFPGGCYRSGDGGKTWTHVFDDRFANCIRISPHDSNLIYLGTTRHPYHDNPTAPGVLVSRDAGDTWEPMNQGLSLPNVDVITPDPTDPKRVYVGTGGNGLFIGEWK